MSYILSWYNMRMAILLYLKYVLIFKFEIACWNDHSTNYRILYQYIVTTFGKYLITIQYIDKNNLKTGIGI